MVLLSLLQSVLVMALLLSRVRDGLPSRVLVLIQAVLTVHLIQHYVQIPAPAPNLTFSLLFAIGPLSYAYVAVSTGSWLRPRVGGLVHFALAVAGATAGVVANELIVHAPAGIPWLRSTTSWLDAASKAHPLLYAVAAYRVLGRYRSRAARIGAGSEVRDRVLWLGGLVVVCGFAPIATAGMEWARGSALAAQGIILWIWAATTLWPRALRSPSHPRPTVRWRPFVCLAE